MIPCIGERVFFHKELIDTIRFGSRRLAHEYLFLKYLTEDPLCIILEVDMKFIASIKQYRIVFCPVDKPSKRHTILLDEEGRYKSSSTFQTTNPLFFTEYIDQAKQKADLYKVPGEVL